MYGLKRDEDRVVMIVIRTHKRNTMAHNERYLANNKQVQNNSCVCVCVFSPPEHKNKNENFEKENGNDEWSEIRDGHKQDTPVAAE